MKVISNQTELTRSLLINPSDTVNASVLAANVAKTVTVPSGAQAVSFSANGDFYVNFNGGTAAVPSVDITNGNGAELNPSTRYIAGLSSFSIVAPAATVVVLSYYSVT